MRPLAAARHQQSTRHISLSRSLGTAAGEAQKRLAATTTPTKTLNNGRLSATPDEEDAAQLKPFSSVLEDLEKNALAQDETTDGHNDVDNVDYDTDDDDADNGFSDGDISDSTATALDEKRDNNSATLTQPRSVSIAITDSSSSSIRRSNGNGLSLPAQKPETLLGIRSHGSGGVELPSQVTETSPSSSYAMLRFVPTLPSTSGNKFEQISLDDSTSSTTTVSPTKQMVDSSLTTRRLHESNKYTRIGNVRQQPQPLSSDIEDDILADSDSDIDSYVDSDVDPQQQQQQKQQLDRMFRHTAAADEESVERNDVNAEFFGQLPADEFRTNWRKIPAADDYVEVSGICMCKSTRVRVL